MHIIREAVEIYREEGYNSLISSFRDFLYYEMSPYLNAVVFLVLFPLVSLFGRNPEIWVISNLESGQEFSENSKYLFLHAVNSQDDSVRPIWITKNRSTRDALRDEGYEAHLTTSLRARFYTLRASAVFFSSSLNSIKWGYCCGATLVQLTHGIPLKAQSTESNVVKRLIFEHLATFDYICTTSATDYRHKGRFSEYHDSGSNFVAHAYRTGRELRTGYPRSDILYRDIPGSEIGVPDEMTAVFDEATNAETVVGYFPTFRERRRSLEPFEERVIGEFLEERNAALVIKPHRHMAVEYDGYGADRVYTLPSNGDIYPFLDSIDVMITDYSSIYFDYLLTDNPVVFYTFDMETYSEHRGLHPDYEDVTLGAKANDTEELVGYLEECLETDRYDAKRKQLRDEFFEHQDGDSAGRIYRRIAQKCSE